MILLVDDDVMVGSSPATTFTW